MRRNPQWSWSLLDLIWTKLRKRCGSDDLMPIEVTMEEITRRGADTRRDESAVAPWNRRSVRTTVRANPMVREHGSGYHGVVMPTRNPKWVFKITRDVSEAKFWNLLRLLGKQCSIVGIAKCSPVYRVPIRLTGMAPYHSTAYVLWREAADVAGSETWVRLAEGRETMSRQAIVRVQQALDLLRGDFEQDAAQAYQFYLKNPMLESTGLDLLEILAATGVIVTDIHLNNWGIVPRRPRKATLLDPGEVHFTDSRWDIEPPTL